MTTGTWSTSTRAVPVTVRVEDGVVVIVRIARIAQQVSVGIGLFALVVDRVLREWNEVLAAEAARATPSTAHTLRRVLEACSEMPDDELGWRCEQTIRNYDPCISCATHFLKLRVERR